MSSVRWLLLAVLVACSSSAFARQSDRNQPMDINAGRTVGSLDDSIPTVMSGNVTIDQGSLHAEAARAEIQTSNGEIERVVLTGSPATLQQQMDDGTRMSAVASKIDYNVTTDTVVFTGKVNIKQPRGTLSGERVVYNMTSGQVTSGGEGNGRVKMRIMPKTTGSKPPAADSGAKPAQAQPDESDGSDADSPVEGG
ncbi:lipopolysaccharide transport periplasmic protein LptA [Lysobacter sp. A421]